MEEFSNYICGYYICKEVPPVWEAAVGEALVSKEPENAFNRYAVAVKKEGTISAFASKAVAGVHAVFVTGRYTVASVSVERNGDPTIVIMS